ncbi:MAG: NAD-dependent epimerase/dehydratase family protein [Actinomycetota bacterium]
MILVTGASGFIGLHLVRALVARGESVRGLARSREKLEAVEAEGAEAFPADVVDAKALARSVRDCRLIFHLAGTYRGSATEMRAAHIGGTRNLLDVSDSGSRVVFASSTSVYGWRGPWPADERTPACPITDYGIAKLAAEQAVLGWDRGETVIIRPTIVYGPGDLAGMLPRAYRLMSRGLRIFPGAGTNRIHLVHVDDLVRGLLIAGERGSGTYVMAGPESSTIGGVFAVLAQGAGLPRPRFGLPVPTTRALAGAAEVMWHLATLTGEPPLTRHSVDILVRDREFTWEKARSELGWIPRIQWQEGVAELGTRLALESKASTHAGSARAGSGFRETIESIRPPAAAEGVRPGDLAKIAGPPIVAACSPGPDWRPYAEDPDEGLGTVYERFPLADILRDSAQATGSTSVLHAPLFGMTGIPGLDCVFLARQGLRVGLLDVDETRLAAVADLWTRLGLAADTYLAPWPDISGWPDLIPAKSYDLVFSFAALWWFADPAEALRIQARWARKGLLVALPNRNVFMALRSRWWDRDMFERLSLEALDLERIKAVARAEGLEAVREGFFDLPPFPDTAFPIRRLLRRNKPEGEAARPAASVPRSFHLPAAGTGDEGFWRWGILPYLTGRDPGLEARCRKLAFLERLAPERLARLLAHHRYVLLAPRG